MITPSEPGYRRSSQRLKITAGVYDQIRDTVGSQRAETGGMLGGFLGDGIVSVFHFDKSALRTSASYSPNAQELSLLLSQQWNPQGVRLLGFVHSHPCGYKAPSGGDLEYSQEILASNPDLDRLYLPIVHSDSDSGQFKIHPYVALRHKHKVVLERCLLEIVREKNKRTRCGVGESCVCIGGIESISEAHRASKVPKSARIASDHGMPERVSIKQLTGGVNNINLNRTFERVRTAYDLGRMLTSREVVVGVGGAAEFVERQARAGVREFVLIDPDTVSESNLATQQTYRSDIGRAKVVCLQERIRDINPNATVVAIQKPLEEISDMEFQRLAEDPMAGWLLKLDDPWGLSDLQLSGTLSLTPSATLLCGLTDSFTTQARVARLGLHFGIPTLCAQVYAEGYGAEITFTHPATTPACHRCALRSRYEAYLQNGFQNDVTSDGTPIYATNRLNALKEALALAILHHGTAHARWGGLLTRIGNRNLVQIRMNPDAPLPVFERTFAGADHEKVLFDDVVWLPQMPDCPKNGFPYCPDCGGTGDLRTAIGTFVDTRQMRL